MEKFGVDEDINDEKVAEARDTQRCPSCSGPLSPIEKTGVLHCPACGTKPFEGE